MTRLSVAKNRKDIAVNNMEYVPRRNEIGMAYSTIGSPLNTGAASVKNSKKNSFLSPQVGKHATMDSLSQHRTSASIAGHLYGITPATAAVTNAVSPRTGPLSVREVPASFIASQKVPKLIDTVQH